MQRLPRVEWALANGWAWPAGHKAGETAATVGNLSVLQRARRDGCVWGRGRTCFMAAVAGNLDCLRWAQENGCPWDRAICRAAYELLGRGCAERALQRMRRI